MLGGCCVILFVELLTVGHSVSPHPLQLSLEEVTSEKEELRCQLASVQEEKKNEEEEEEKKKEKEEEVLKQTQQQVRLPETWRWTTRCCSNSHKKKKVSLRFLGWYWCSFIDICEAICDIVRKKGLYK